MSISLFLTPFTLIRRALGNVHLLSFSCYMLTSLFAFCSVNNLLSMKRGSLNCQYFFASTGVEPHGSPDKNEHAHRNE